MEMESSFWLRFCREWPDYGHFLIDEASKEREEITLDETIESFNWCKRLKTFLINTSMNWTR